jgi:hypothetical protein
MEKYINSKSWLGSKNIGVVSEELFWAAQFGPLEWTGLISLFSFLTSSAYFWGNIQ